MRQEKVRELLKEEGKTLDNLIDKTGKFNQKETEVQKSETRKI